MSDYLSDEEQVERLKSWWSETARFYSLCVCCGARYCRLELAGSYQEDAGEQNMRSLDNI